MPLRVKFSGGGKESEKTVDDGDMIITSPLGVMVAPVNIFVNTNGESSFIGAENNKNVEADIKNPHQEGVIYLSDLHLGSKGPVKVEVTLDLHPKNSDSSETSFTSDN